MGLHRAAAARFFRLSGAGKPFFYFRGVLLNFLGTPPVFKDVLGQALLKALFRFRNIAFLGRICFKSRLYLSLDGEDYPKIASRRMFPLLCVHEFCQR